MLRKSDENSSTERGVAMVEFVLVVPAFILISLWGVIEVGTSIIAHQEITEVAREGARLLSRTANLQEGNFVSTACVNNGPGTFVTNDPSGPPERSHEFAHLRVCQLLQLHGYDPERVEISSSFVVGPSGQPFFNDNVLVHIAAKHRSPVFGTEFLTLGVQRTAAYLLKADRIN